MPTLSKRFMIKEGIEDFTERDSQIRENKIRDSEDIKRTEIGIAEQVEQFLAGNYHLPCLACDLYTTLDCRLVGEAYERVCNKGEALLEVVESGEENYTIKRDGEGVKTFNLN